MTTANRRPFPLRAVPAPFAPIALGVIAGILVDRFMIDATTRRWAALALGAGVVALVARRWSRLASVALLAAYVALGAGWHHHRWSDLALSDLARYDWSRERPAWLRGVLVEVPAYRPGIRADDEGSTSFVMAIQGRQDGRAWHAASGRVRVFVSGDRTDLAMGQAIQAAGSLKAMEGPLNPGEVNFRDLWRARGVRLQLAVEGSRGVWVDPEGVDSPWHRRLGRARERSRALLVERLEPAVAPLAAALLLGRREAVDPDDNDAFARTGTTHLLAISGLHMQAMAAFLWVALRLVGLGRRGALGGVIGATIAYAALVGGMPSVTRSAIMTVAICLAKLLDRQIRAANLMALAGLGTLLFNPAYLFDVGCQLSFLGVASLIWAVPPVVRSLPPALARPFPPFSDVALPLASSLGTLDAVERFYEPRWKKAARWGLSWVVVSLVVSAVVWGVTAPLVVSRFHVVPAIGILLNVPLIPLTSVALITAGLTLLISWFSTAAVGPTAWLCSWALKGTQAAVRRGVELPWGHVFDPGPPWWWTLGFYGLVAWWMWGQRGRRWSMGALAVWLAVGFLDVVWPARPETLEADVLAVGHGLAVVVQGNDGRVMLYDCGKLGDPRVGRKVIAPALWARGVRRIERVVLSHADADHYNGLPDLLDRFAVGTVARPPGFGGPENPLAEDLLERVRARGIPIVPIADGDSFALGDAVVASLHPPPDWEPTAPDNARSLVLEVASRGRACLLTGDLDGSGLLRLVDRPVKSWEVVLAPHHGGRTANPDWFYSWARASLVVLSQTRPTSAATDAVTAAVPAGVVVLRTWRDGAIRLRWNAGGIAARGFLEATSSAPPVWGFSWPRWGVALLGALAGLFVCVVLAVVTFGAWFLVAPGVRIEEGDTDPDSWEPIEITAGDGVRLWGAWKPADGGPRGTVLLLHGIGETGAALRARGEFLTARGWDVLRPDSRGKGRSGGTFVSYGGREGADARRWLDALPRSSGPIVVWGRSMGAAIALRVAADDPRVAGLILEVPYADLTTAVAAGLRRKGLPGFLAGWIVRRASALAGVPIAQPRPLDLARSVRVPVLVLSGTDDPVVAPSEIARLAEAFPAPPTWLAVPGAQHANVFDLGGPALQGSLTAFLNSVAAPGSALAPADLNGPRSAEGSPPPAEGQAGRPPSDG
jgi:competence protein ComEC